MTGYGTQLVKYDPAFKNELGDVFYSLITIANEFDVDLEDALFEAIEKYHKRLTKGGMGSKIQ